MMENLDKAYRINNYRFREAGDFFLVTTDHGSWIFLNKKEFDILKKGVFKEGSIFFEKLEEKGIIITNKNEEVIIENIRKRNHFLFEGTSLHIVLPTLRCNQNCVYCHASSKSLDSKGNDMEEETAKKVVDFIFQSPSKYLAIEFQGGEPLLNFKIVKFIVTYAKEINEKQNKNLVFRLVTNLSLLDDEKLNFLIREKVDICTSLDGPSFIHNKNRPFMKNKDSYPFVIQGIKKVMKEYSKHRIKDRRVNALITVTREALQYPKEIIDEYLNIGLEGIHLRFLNNLGDARPVWEQINYSEEQFLVFWKKAMDYILELNKRGIYFREWSSLIILRKILTNSDPNFLEMRSPCGAAIGQLSYTPSGDIFSCDEARMVKEDLFKLGNVKKDNYKKVISSNQTCSLISSSINDGQICNYCVYKPYCGVCPVCNFVEQGSIIAKIPETSRCKIYKEQFTYLFNRINNPEDKKVFLSWLEKE